MGVWTTIPNSGSATGSTRIYHSGTQSASQVAKNFATNLRPTFPDSSGSYRGAASGARRTSSSPGTSTLDDYFSRLQSITAANNAWSASQAQKQMDFQKQSADAAMKFNHDEAELSRLWQERMSNTAHQREIKDLQAAGLNPVLSAMGGSGAPVTSGATASGYTSSGAKGDTDTSLAPSLVSLLGSVISANASMANTLTSAQAQERIARLGADTDIFRALTSAASAREVTSMQTSASKYAADLQAHTSVTVAGINGETSRVVARIGAGASVSAAQIHAAGQAAAAQISGQYGLSIARTNQLANVFTHVLDNASKESINNKSLSSSERIASANRDLQRELQQNGFDFQFDFAEDQYNRDWKLHMWDNGTDIIQSLIGAIGSYGVGSRSSHESFSGLLGLAKLFG